MWFYNWSFGWFWIVPLLGMLMMVGCLVMMVRGWYRGGCCCSGEHRHRDTGSGRPPDDSGRC